MKQIAGLLVLGSCALWGCGSDDGGGDVQSEPVGTETAAGSDDRALFTVDVGGVRAQVADCFVVEVSDGSRRYQTTVEVANESDATQTVTVTIDADLGRGGVSDSFEVPAGAGDAWAVTSDAETDDEVGDVECADFINDIELSLGPTDE